MRLWNWLTGRELHPTVDEIMRPLTRIHDALKARHVVALEHADAAADRAHLALIEAESHKAVATLARDAHVKLSALLA